MERPILSDIDAALPGLSKLKIVIEVRPSFIVVFKDKNLKPLVLLNSQSPIQVPQLSQALDLLNGCAHRSKHPASLIEQ